MCPLAQSEEDHRNTANNQPTDPTTRGTTPNDQMTNDTTEQAQQEAGSTPSPVPMPELANSPHKAPSITLHHMSACCSHKLTQQLLQRCSLTTSTDVRSASHMCSKRQCCTDQ